MLPNDQPSSDSYEQLSKAPVPTGQRTRLIILAVMGTLFLITAIFLFYVFSTSTSSGTQGLTVASAIAEYDNSTEDPVELLIVQNYGAALGIAGRQVTTEPLRVEQITHDVSSEYSTDVVYVSSASDTVGVVSISIWLKDGVTSVVTSTPDGNGSCVVTKGPLGSRSGTTHVEDAANSTDCYSG